MSSAGDFVYRRRYNGLQIEVRCDSDKPEKVNISTLSWIAAVAAYEHCVTIKHFR